MVFLLNSGRLNRTQMGSRSGRRREYVDRESHYLWGRRYLLGVGEVDQAPSVALKGKRMRLQVRPQHGEEKRREIVEGWYREQVKSEAPALIAKWEPLMGVKVEAFAYSA